MNPAGNVPVKVENDVPEVAKVEEAKSNPQPVMEEQEPEAVRKLFVGGVSLNTTDENLHAFYGQFGPITDCIVMRDPATKRSRGFGFVTFEKKADLDKAMESRPHQIDGKVVDPKRAVPREQQKTQPVGSSHRLYIAGLQDMHTEEILTNYFTKYGKVERCDVLMDKTTGRPRGFAFVTFADYDSVDRALLELHTIEDIRCQVKKAFSKDGANRASQSRERPKGFNPRASYGSHSAGQWSSSAGGYGGGGAAYASYGYAGYPSSQNYPPTYANSGGSYGTTSQGAWTTLPAWGQSSNWGQPQGGWGPGGAQSSTYQQPAAAPFSPTSSTNAWDPYHNSAGTAHGYGSRNQF